MGWDVRCELGFDNTVVAVRAGDTASKVQLMNGAQKIHFMNERTPKLLVHSSPQSSSSPGRRRRGAVFAVMMSIILMTNEQRTLPR